MRRRRSIVLAFVLSFAFALCVSACGGGAPSPGVASIASSTTPATSTSTTQSAAPATKSLGGGPSGHFRIAMNVGNATLGAKFSTCMRKHGVTNFPDPNSQGIIQFGSGIGIDPNSPAFTSAMGICQKLLPNGGQPTPQQRAQQQRELLAYSKCMRDHGIEDFPDPSNGGLHLTGGPGSDLDPNNAQFQAAQQACQGKLPFKAAKTGGSSSAGK